MTQVAPATASLSEIAALAGPAPAAAPSPATALAQADRPPAAAPPPGGFIASFEWRPTGSSVSIDLPGSQVSVQPAPILSWPPPAGSEVPAPAGATDQFAPGPSPAGWAGSPDSPPPAGGPTGLPASPLASASAGPALPPARLDRLSSEPGPGPEAIAIEACGPIVGAVVCPAGHLNPPYADICRVCRQPVPQQQPIELPRPSLGVLRLSSGGVVNLDRGAVLGRNPRPLAGVTGLQPNLIRIADANRDISGQHLEVRLEDWFVTVRDLGSTNGTQVIAPDRPPVTLRAHEPVSVEPGTRVVLANAFDFLFEALP
ncbi:MAG: FHA domain-containing protein [Propionibacteriaceae bacterium]|nr:FHA domain-containing protein [Propionibacteriaceae bacterium]